MADISLYLPVILYDGIRYLNHENCDMILYFSPLSWNLCATTKYAFHMLFYFYLNESQGWSQL